uniref:hypothetical protein n=1 Tax=Cupriavidus pinatubonensis TaxID=248026 RepID=UPI002159DE4B|nr:hypothetical protein [Cupriavidus pinatubonensis]
MRGNLPIEPGDFLVKRLPLCPGTHHVQLQARVGYYQSLVAVANKHASILWAILAKGEKFESTSLELTSPHPLS